jgi:hypothetical protein
MSSAQRSPTSDRACAIGQYWSNRFATTPNVARQLAVFQ